MKIKPVFHVIIIASLIYIFSSCESEDSSFVNQDRIYTSYELFYNANTDMTYARATFKFGNSAGTLLDLSEGSYVSFNGDTLSFMPLLAYYEKSYAGYVDAGVFEFVDLDGNIFTNTISIHEVQFPDSIETIAQNQSYEFDFVGDLLLDNEVITLTFDGPFENDLEINNFYESGVNSVILSAVFTANLSLGENTVYMDRKYQPELVNTTSAGGHITGRYRPVNTIVVVE
jgi:hypothetical protein